MKKIILFSILLWGFSNLYSSQQVSYAAAPTCQPSSSGSVYCQYNGKVARAYINASNTILVYFDTNMTAAELAESNTTATATYAAALKITPENETFAKAFYATLLTALAANKTVTIQMRGKESIYLKMDRIWIWE